MFKWLHAHKDITLAQLRNLQGIDHWMRIWMNENLNARESLCRCSLERHPYARRDPSVQLTAMLEGLRLLTLNSLSWPTHSHSMVNCVLAHIQMVLSCWTLSDGHFFQPSNVRQIYGCYFSSQDSLISPEQGLGLLIACLNEALCIMAKPEEKREGEQAGHSYIVYSLFHTFLENKLIFPLNSFKWGIMVLTLEQA